MLRRIFAGAVILVVAALVTFLASVPALAMDSRSGETVTVASGEVVNDDLYVMGRTIVINGTVNGDVFGLGQTIIINGNVNGAVTIAGQTITLSGEVAHGVRLAGQTLIVNNSITRDMVAFGAAVDLAGQAKIGGDLFLGAGTASIDGLVEGNVKGGGGQITIADGVGGDVELSVDSLTVASTANIKGNLTYTSEDEADVHSAAQIGGKTTHKLPEVKEPAKAGPLKGIGGKFIVLLMTLVTGVVIVLVAPRRSVTIADSIRNKPLSSLGWGALVLFLTPIAAIIVCITVIGIPVALIALVLYAIAIYLSQIFVGLLIGRLIIGRFREVETKAILVGTLAAGLAILFVFGLIPYLGFIIGLAVALFALGAMVLSIKTLRA